MKPVRSAVAKLTSLGLVLACTTRAYAQDTPDLGRLAEFVRWTGVVFSIPVVLGAFFLIRLLDNVEDQLSTRFSNRRPTIQQIQTIARFLIYVVTFVITIRLSMRLDATAITVIGGALAFAVGFALRDLVASFIAGITIMFDRPFQVGDRVKYGGEYGDILTIGLRSVRLQTLNNEIVTIPNNRVFTDVTSAGTYGVLEMQVPMDFYIGVDQDVRLATEIVREACLTSPYVYLDHPVEVFAKQVILQDYFAIHLRARPSVFDCKYEEPFVADVHIRVLEAFHERNINPPAVMHRSLGSRAHDDSVRANGAESAARAH